MLKKIKCMTKKTAAFFLALSMLLGGVAAGLGVFTNTITAGERESVNTIVKKILQIVKYIIIICLFCFY